MSTYIVEITQLSTGVMRPYSMGHWDEEDGGSEYMWSEGSFACDCNRALFFSRAGNEPESANLDPCTEGKYRVICRSTDGVVLYHDQPAEAKARRA